MATTTSVYSQPAGVNIQKIFYETMGNADDGTPHLLAGLTEGSIQATGTFGSATVTLQGSNDGTNYANLTDMSGGTAISMTAAGVQSFRTRALYIRPKTAGGTGTDVDVTIILRSQ